jgi:SRSO17 transposase
MSESEFMLRSAGGHWQDQDRLLRLIHAKCGRATNAREDHSTWCPAGTPIDTLVRVEGQRWAIEDAFETAKTELGMTHNETRSWHGWHRHVSLVMLAFAMMVVVRQHANTLTSPQKRNNEARLQRWYDGLSRKSAAWPHASSNAGSSLPL